MKAQITPAVRALAHGAASDENRPILNGVNFNHDQAVVADGFMLVIKQLPSPEMDLGESIDDGISEVNVPADALKACKGDKVDLQTIESLRQVPTAELLKSDATVSMSKIVARMTGEFVIEADAIQGTYPDYTKLFGSSPLKGQIAINTRLLKRMLKTLPDDEILRIRVSEPDRPIEIQCSDPDGDIPIRGLIMPLNCNWNDVVWKTLGQG